MTQHEDHPAKAVNPATEAEHSDPQGVGGEQPAPPGDAVDQHPRDEPSSKKAASSSLERVSELSLALQADLGRAASAIMANEFTASGSGHAGSLFRAIQSLETDSPDHIEAWSILLEVAESIWSAEHYEASLAFVRSAHLSLNTPPIFQERVVSAIEFAENAMLVQRAEKRFSEGDVDGALNLAAQLKGQDKSSYIEEIEQRHRGRIRTRKVAFAFAGVAISCLMGVSIMGIMQVRTLLQDPPSIALPEFPTTDLIEDLKNSRIIDGDISEIPTILGSLNEQSSTPADTVPPSEDKASGQTLSEPDDTTTPEAGIVPGETPVEPDNASDPLNVAAGGAEPVDPPARPLKTATAEAIYNCALGQAVSKRAIEIVVASGNQGKAGPVEAFVKKVNAACAALDTTQAELDMVAAQIPDAQIETIAENIVP